MVGVPCEITLGVVQMADKNTEVYQKGTGTPKVRRCN